MDLEGWLQQLAAAYGSEPRPATINAYLEILERWDLTGEQWLQLRMRAVLRFQYLPRICELDSFAASSTVRRRSRPKTSGAVEPNPGNAFRVHRRCG